MRQELLAAREWSRVFTEGGERYRITARGELIHYAGNTSPHFAITGDVVRLARNGRRVECHGGAIHEDILRHFPTTAPLVRVHLADDAGVPMHAYANAGYWAGHTKYQTLDVARLAAHLRITEERAADMVEYVAHYWGELDAITTPEMAWRDACEVFALPEQWRQEAGEALALLNRTTAVAS